MILVSEGSTISLPGSGVVFCNMEEGNSVVTVAETGVKTTIYGPGKVIVNGRDVYQGKCLVDQNGDPI